jgi:acyl-CoA synthetase (AMP-forming)/AMP-acid ligase II
VNPDAGTLAAFYYKAVRDFELPTKDCLAAPGQDEKFSHVGFDRHVYAYAVGLIDALGVKKGSKIGLWLGNEVESLVLQYAAALIGAQSVTIDPAASWEAVLQTVADEWLRVLVVPARAGTENRGAKLAEAFAEELDYAKFEAGTEPLRSKRFRGLKWLVSTGGDAPDGVVRLRDVPVYGNSA